MKAAGSRSAPRTAIVLSGGGARGAYEVGVLSYLREELEPELGTPLPFDVICGTSVGALHACFLAATSENPQTQGGRLRELWHSLRLEELLQFGACDVVALAKALLSPSGSSRAAEVALLDAAGLKRVALRHIPWTSIGRALRS